MNVKLTLACAAWLVTVSCGGPADEDDRLPVQEVVIDGGATDAAITDATITDAAITDAAITDAVVTDGMPDGSVHLCCCGNGDVEPGEACDDGNADDGDGCSSSCALE